MALPLAAALAMPVIGGIAGNLMSQGDRNASIDTITNYYNQLSGLSIPDTEKMRIALEQYQSVGQFAPQTETAEQLAARSALEDIQLDPRLRQAQLDQLSVLQQLGQSSFTPEEQAQLDKSRRQIEADNQSRIRALLENQQARGVASGESALAAQMLESQAAANRQAQMAQDLNAQAFRRALEAKAGAAGLAGNIESSDYSRGLNLAQARDTRELQNVGLRSGTQQRNVASLNEAQKFNLQNQQRLAESNVALRNQQQQYNKQLEQQRFENELKKQGLMSGAAGAQSAAYGQRAADTSKMWAGIGGGLGQIAGASMMSGGGTPDSTQVAGAVQGQPLKAL